MLIKRDDRKSKEIGMCEIGTTPAQHPKCWDLKCEPLSSTLDVLECKMRTNDDCYSILTSGWANLIGLVPLWLNSLVSVFRSFPNG
jgi:hypothetical protein